MPYFHSVKFYMQRLIHCIRVSCLYMEFMNLFECICMYIFYLILLFTRIFVQIWNCLLIVCAFTDAALCTGDWGFFKIETNKRKGKTVSEFPSAVDACSSTQLQLAFYQNGGKKFFGDSRPRKNVWCFLCCKYCGNLQCAGIYNRWFLSRRECVLASVFC